VHPFSSRLARALMFVGVLVLLAWPVAATATDARSMALAQSPLFEDDTDIFAYPASLPRHAGQISLDVGVVAASSGAAVEGEASDPRDPLARLDALPLTAAGGASYGDRLAAALYLGRPAPQSALALRAFVFGEETVLVPRRLVEAVVAYRMSEQHSLGARLGIAYRLRRTTSEAAGDNGVVSTLTELALGHGWSSSLGRSDTSVTLELPYFRRMQRFEVVHQIQPVNLSWALAHRSIWPVARQWELGVSALLRRDSLFLELPAASRSAGGAGWDFRLEVGPRLLVSERVALALSALIARRSWEISELDSPPARSQGGGEESWTLPGLRLAFEGYLTPWMSLRMGLVGRISSQTGLDGAGQRATEASTDLRWQLGLGFEGERLRVDGVISARFLEVDETRISEQLAPAVFSRVSLAYAF